MMTQLLQQHWEWQDDRRPMRRHGSVKRPTTYLTRMDIKTTFDVTRSRHIAKIMEDHAVHRWIVTVLGRTDYVRERGKYSHFCDIC